MSFALTYAGTMGALAEIAMASDTPSYVRERALTTLVRELSPLHTRHDQVMQALGAEGPATAIVVRDLAAEAEEFYAAQAAAEAAAAQQEGVETDEEEEEADEDEPP